MRVVVGRERELRSVAAFLAEARSQPAALVIEGEPGIGKTTVWHEGIRLAEAEGFRVLSSRPAESEAKLSFSALADLVEPLYEDGMEALPEPQRRALAIALLRVSPGDSPPDARAVSVALRALLVRSAEEGPVAVAIDDAQWLDSASATAIEFALRRVRGPIALLATRRPGTALDVVAGSTPPLRLEAMSLGAIHHVIRHELGSSPSRPLLARVHETARGNPFFALQLARTALEGGAAPGSPLPLPRDLSELILRRIEKLGRATREVLLTVAASAAPSRALLEAAHGDVDDALEEAERAGLLEVGDRALRFAHPLYGAAVYASAGHEHRRRVHARLAAFVREAEEQARHLALAATPPDERAAKRVHAAAQAVAARGSPAAAVELVEQAIRLGDEAGNVDDDRDVDLGTYLFMSGDSVRAAEVLQRVDNWADRSIETQIRGLWTLTDALYWTDGGYVAVDAGEEALRVAEAPEVHAALHTKISSHQEFDMVRALEHADAALALLEPMAGEADPRVLALALGMRARNRLALGLGLDREQVERAIELDQSGEIAQSYGQWLKYVDDFDGSRRWLERIRRRHEEVGDDVSIPNVLQQLAMTECWAGNLDLAAAHALRAVELADEMEITPVGPLRIRAVVEAHRGNEAEVRALEQRIRDDGLVTLATLFLESALGLLELSLGNREAADGHLRTAIGLAEQQGQLEPGVHRVHGDAAEAAVALGDRSRAVEIAEYLVGHGRRTDHAWSSAVSARIRALVHAHDGELDSALAAIEDALAAHERLPMPYELARTLLAKGQIERRALRRRDAKASLEQAQALFREIGAKLWAERTADELRRIPIRRGAPGDLTPTERRIAELAATGLTNNEVAKAAFVSPKTVEANLARVYAKLGIRSRAELGGRMGELGADTAS